MRTTATLALAATLAAVLGACSSSYLPRTPGRIAMIMRDGGPAYYRDGQVYRVGFLGSGLRRAVAGNPAAEAAARAYHDRMRDGLLLTGGGLLCSVLATAHLAATLEPEPEGDQQVPASAWIAVGCLVASMGGLGYMVSAEPYRYDAINIFNDTAPSWTPAGPGALGQLDHPTESLRMRD